MPRDLSQEAAGASLKEDSIQGSMPPITRSPEDMDPRMGVMTGDDEDAMIDALSQRNEKRDELHPYTQTLNMSDLESCVRLEAETFPEHERATREKFEYRLKACGELCLGIYTSQDTSNAKDDIPTAKAAAPVYTGAPERKAVLLGHLVATKTTNATVTDDDMAIPKGSSNASGSEIGHNEQGRTLCIHSLAVLPAYQRRGLGKTLLKAYVQRMESQGVADRVALIAHDELIPYYEGLGFRSLGKSKAQFGGGGWTDMVKDLTNEEEMEEVEEEIEVRED